MFQVFNVIPAGFFNNLASGSNQRIYADCMQLIYKEYEREISYRIPRNRIRDTLAIYFLEHHVELSEEEYTGDKTANDMAAAVIRKFISKEIIFEINENLKKSGTKLFIDECFIEFISGWEEKTSALFKSENIFILRALTKFFALPGLRLGYGICFDKKITEKINEIREPWSVNGFADLAGKVILNDIEYIKNSEKWILEERKYFTDSLKEIEKSGRIKVYDTETNFILIKLFEMTSEEFKNRMEEKNILVRNCSNFKFLDNSFVRLAIKDREKNKKVIGAVKEVLL